MNVKTGCSEKEQPVFISRKIVAPVTKRVVHCPRFPAAAGPAAVDHVPSIIEQERSHVPFVMAQTKSPDVPTSSLSGGGGRRAHGIAAVTERAIAHGIRAHRTSPTRGTGAGPVPATDG